MSLSFQSCVANAATESVCQGLRQTPERENMHQTRADADIVAFISYCKASILLDGPPTIFSAVLDSPIYLPN